uniref:CHCH domain-containing protein n=1 Tax=Triticum aestivum TaxID=4565 RepID=A0A3B6RHT8_WHEAT
MSSAPDADHCDAGTIMADVLSKGRESCYKARDAFYACVEKHADKKPTEIATMGLLFPADCKKSRAQYVSSCRPSWVTILIPIRLAASRQSLHDSRLCLLLLITIGFGFLRQVRHFDRQHCAKKRVQRLLDGDDDGRGPMSLPQPYTFKQ